MSALYKAIAEEILWSFLKDIIDAIKSDSKFSLTKFRKTKTYKSQGSEQREFFFNFINSVKEGLPEREIKSKFLKRYVEMVTNSIRESAQKGVINQRNLSKAFDQYRSYPALRDLSERDFYLFMAYSIVQP